MNSLLYSFELDDAHAIVWINFQLDRFRINCCDPAIIHCWARFWFAREFPFSSETERSKFKVDFRFFLEGNVEKIEQLAKEIGIKKQVALAQLYSEIRKEMGHAAKQAKPELAKVKSAI